MVAGSRSIPSPGPAPLYCAIRPQTGTRAKWLSKGSTACRTAPPTLLEVHVDSVGTSRRQSGGKIGGTVIDRGVEA
jgi:hypothetical protein